MKHYILDSADASRSATELERYDQNVPTLRQGLKAIQGDGNVLYAIRTPDGLVKIGCTSNLAQRHYTVGTEILAVQPGDFDDESAIHDSLRESCAKGREYYHVTPQVLEVVNRMRQHFNLPHIAA